jgi:uncharacterized membrane protein
MKSKNGNLLNRQLIRFLLAAMFCSAGVAHFLFDEMFTEVIPKILPLRPMINYLVGGVEILLGVLYFSSARKMAYLGTFILLVIYIWAHVNFIQMGSCTVDFCISPWIAWVRLIVVHPILLYLNYFLLEDASNKDTQ